MIFWPFRRPSTPSSAEMARNRLYVIVKPQGALPSHINMNQLIKDLRTVFEHHLGRQPDIETNVPPPSPTEPNQTKFEFSVSFTTTDLPGVF